MSNVPGFYSTAPLRVEAMEVTMGSIKDVVNWCGGLVSVDNGEQRVLVPGVDDSSLANMYDYVVKNLSDGRFSVMPPREFVDKFKKNTRPVNYPPLLTSKGFFEGAPPEEKPDPNSPGHHDVFEPVQPLNASEAAGMIVQSRPPHHSRRV